MNGPPIAPEDGQGPDQLDRAYQQASARDTTRPGPQVRAAILAQARTSARPAANDPRWHWQAAAGIAAMGFVGLLSWHFIRVAPPELVARTTLPTPLADQAPSAPPSAAPPAPLPVMPAIAAAGAPARLAEQSVARTSGAALRAADEVAGGAPERESERVLRTVRALYPELFDPALSRGVQPHVTVTIALNADGSIYAVARAAGAERTPSPGDAAALIAQVFGSATGALAQSGVTMTAEGVTVIYGIRAAGR